MTDEYQKLIDDCIGGHSFGWENFVDKFLPQISRVAEFCLAENSLDSKNTDLKNRLITEIFQQFSANEHQLLRDYDGESELPTYIAVIAQRQANDFLSSQKRA